MNKTKSESMNQTLEVKLPPSRPMSMPSHEDLMRQHLRDENLPEAVMPACPINKVLRGQKALVTGANSGIGQAVALALAHAGADVVINYVSRPEAAEFLCSREAIREFKRRGIRKEVSCAAGKIICMSSVHEVIPWAGHVNYAASKGGVMLMMKSIAQEVAPHRIRVNSVCPGAVRTPINMEAWGTHEAYRELMKLIPYKRIGEPDDIGRAAVWLASDDSDYVHGASIFVDGGMTLYPGFETGG